MSVIKLSITVKMREITQGTKKVGQNEIKMFCRRRKKNLATRNKTDLKIMKINISVNSG